MEIERVTRENGQKEWFIDLDNEEAFDLAMRLLDSYRKNGFGGFCIHNDLEWFRFSIYSKENNAP